MNTYISLNIRSLIYFPWSPCRMPLLTTYRILSSFQFDFFLLLCRLIMSLLYSTSFFCHYFRVARHAELPLLFLLFQYISSTSQRSLYSPFTYSTTGKCHLYISRQNVYSNALIAMAFQSNSSYLTKTNMMYVPLPLNLAHFLPLLTHCSHDKSPFYSSITAIVTLLLALL